MSEKQQQVASHIKEQLEELLRMASENDMDMLSYLIEMALLEVKGTTNRKDT